jgi:hypothetical protein
MWFDVIEMHALQAVRELGDGSDVLLMSWPTVTEAAAAAVLAWGCERDVIFIGEMTDYVRGHLGGCATDAFFEMTEVMSVIESYEPGNVLERAVVLRTRPEYIHTTQATDFR